MGFGSSSSGQNKHIRIIIFRTCLHKSSIKICNRNILEREKIWKMNEPNGWCFQHVLERFGSLQHGARRSVSTLRCCVGGEPTQHNKSPTDFPVRWAEIRRKEVGKDAKYLFACLCTLIWSRLGSRENYTVNNSRMGEDPLLPPSSIPKWLILFLAVNANGKWFVWIWGIIWLKFLFRKMWKNRFSLFFVSLIPGFSTLFSYLWHLCIILNVNKDLCEELKNV